MHSISSQCAKTSSDVIFAMYFLISIKTATKEPPEWTLLAGSQSHIKN